MKSKHILRSFLLSFGASLIALSSASAQLTWDPGSGGTTDGGGNWLGSGEWWDGSNNVDWTDGSDAFFGNGGAGGTVTFASPVTANSLTFNAFSGSYTLGSNNGQTLTVNNGITVNSGAGTVNFNNLVDNGGTDLTIDGTVAPVANRSAANVYFDRGISGSGDYVQNYDGVTWFRNVAPTYTGDTIINGGVMRMQTTNGGYLNSIPSDGNITLNGGVLEAYWADNFTRSLGSGPGEIQLTGGASGFSMHGSNTLTVNLGGSGSTIQWGSASFDPTALVLQTQYADNTSRVEFENGIDLNGAQRTIQVSAGEDGKAYAEMEGIFSDSTNTTAGIIKTGDGLLRLAAPNDGTGYTFTGSIVGQGGRILFGTGFSTTWDNESLPSTVNLELNNTLALGCFNFSRELGSGAGQVQITGGRSGFSMLQGDRTDITLGSSEVVWGSTFFNPSVFVMNDDANGNGSFDSTSVLRWNNNIDLNGADRTIETPSTGAAGNNNPNNQAFGQLIGTGGLINGDIRNTGGSAGGIIKDGPGVLGFSGTNTFDGDITVNQGGVFFNQLVSMPENITVSLSDGSSIGVTVGGSGWTGGTSGVGTIGGLLAGQGGQAGSTVTYAGNTDLGFNVVGDVTYAGDIANIGSDTSVTLGRNTDSGSATLAFSGNNTYSGGTIVQGGGNYIPTLGINSATAIGTGALTLNGGNIDNTSGAAVTLTTNNAQFWNSNFTFVGTNDLDMGTGAVTINGNRTVTVNGSKLSVGGIGQSSNNRSLTKAGTGTLEINGTSTYTGATNVNAGTLLVNGITDAGNVTVASGATLGGSGTIGGATTINDGGTLAPGNSPGVLSFGSSLTLSGTANTAMEIAGITRGTEYDGINVVTALTYGGDLTLNLGATFSDGNYSFNLFDFASESGDFSSITLAGLYSGSFSFDGSDVWSATTNSGNESWTFTQSTGDLDLTVVPEPSAVLLVGLTGLLLLRRRRS